MSRHRKKNFEKNSAGSNYLQSSGSTKTDEKNFLGPATQIRSSEDTIRSWQSKYVVAYFEPKIVAMLRKCVALDRSVIGKMFAQLGNDSPTIKTEGGIHKPNQVNFQNMHGWILQ